MTEDYTQLMQLPTRELIDRARMATGLTTSAAQIMRALADKLDDTDAALTETDMALTQTQRELADAESRADSWREECQALQRQLDLGRAYG